VLLAIICLWGCGGKYTLVACREDMTEADYLKATWLEIKVDDPAHWKARLQAFGVKEVNFPDPTRFYFQAPGGPVFRLAPMGGL